MDKIIDLIVRVAIPEEKFVNHQQIMEWLSGLGSTLVGNCIPAESWNGISATAIYTHIDDTAKTFDLGVLLHADTYSIAQDGSIMGRISTLEWRNTGIKLCQEDMRMISRVIDFLDLNPNTYKEPIL